jgi:hypothetical protein
MNAGGVPNTCKSNENPFFGLGDSGERVSNTLVTCPEVGDNSAKAGLIPHVLWRVRVLQSKAPVLREGPAAYQLVGRVMAYQGSDG